MKQVWVLADNIDVTMKEKSTRRVQGVYRRGLAVCHCCRRCTRGLVINAQLTVSLLQQTLEPLKRYRRCQCRIVSVDGIFVAVVCTG